MWGGCFRRLSEIRSARGFLSPLLSLSSLFAAKENLWDLGRWFCVFLFFRVRLSFGQWSMLFPHVELSRPSIWEVWRKFSCFQIIKLITSAESVRKFSSNLRKCDSLKFHKKVLAYFSCPRTDVNKFWFTVRPWKMYSIGAIKYGHFRFTWTYITKAEYTENKMFQT